MDVFFYEAFEEEAESLKSFLPSDISAGFTWETIQEQKDEKPPAPVISIRTQSIIPNSWATEIDGILSRSTGYDHIVTYLGKCKEDIPCGYLPLYCSRAVAEQAMLLWMALLRKLTKQMHAFTNFNRDGLTGQECKNKTLLVVGVGNIGYEVVQIGEGLGMKVFGVDIVERHRSVSYTSIEQGLALADIIVCSMNLTGDNISYFNYELLKKAKRDAIFVNIARGEFSPSSDLLRLLDENHLKGIGLDVYNQESQLAVSLRTNQPIKQQEIQATLELAKRPNVILTPHNAFNTQEAVDRKADHSIQQMVHFLKNGNFLWQVPV